MPIVYPSLPSAHQFKKDSSVLLADRNRDKVLIALDALLAEYFGLTAKTVTEIRIKQQKHLAKLWFTADYWLKIVDGGRRYAESANMNASRRPVIYELYKCITETLVARTGVPVSQLPNWLMITFGRGMDEHGVEVDGNDRAKYLSADELIRYRLHFKGGYAFQEKWWDNSRDLVRAESTHSLMQALADKAAHDEGLSGYAVSLGRDFYLSNHFVRTTGQNFYHSSYLGGQSVLCAGTMKVVNGEVVLITNSSGHYRPTDGHLALAVEALAAVGVPLDRLRVRGFPSAECSGTEFLTKVDFNLSEMQAREFSRELRRLLIYSERGNAARASNITNGRLLRELAAHLKAAHAGKKGGKDCKICKTQGESTMMEGALWLVKNRPA